MTRESRTRISRRDAEKALAGDETSAPAVAALLAAARRPAPDGSALPGEMETLASFRVAQAAAAVPVAKRRGRLAAARAAALAAVSTKLAAGTAAALAAGGVVLAASTGALPGTGHSDHSTHRDPSTSASASPNPSSRGLCTAYLAEVAAAPGKALTNPAYTALAALAHPDTVADYCTRLLANDGTTHRPTSLPTGRPGASHPTGAPTPHPTGRPTVQPTAHPRTPTRPTSPASPHLRPVSPQHH